MKQCRSCGAEKPLSEYRKKYATCKECRAERDRSNYLQRTFGITPEQYDEMYAEQEGCCAICGVHQSEVTRRFAVDHDHQTGKVRALLCQPCNTGIGLLQDNYDTILRAADYLRAAKE